MQFLQNVFTEAPVVRWNTEFSPTEEDKSRPGGSVLADTTAETRRDQTIHNRKSRSPAGPAASTITI